MILVLLIIGHKVVRLSVAHCELNPIEMARSQVKGHVKRNNKRYIHFVMDFVIAWYLLRFTLTKVKELVFIKDLRLLHQRSGNH